MPYIEGFVLAVPAANKDAFVRHAANAARFFKEYGVTRHVETWGDDVPDGQVTDFRRAVQATPDEVVVFSWFEYPDKAARQIAQQKMMDDPRMKEMGQGMPFDGKRMIWGGFSAAVDDGTGKAMGYIDGALIAVPEANRTAYDAMSLAINEVLRDFGATRSIDAWEDDVSDGQVTDFRRAVQAKPGERVAFSWIEWPSKAVRDEAWPKVMTDPRLQPEAGMPFDGQRMVMGGFAPVFDA